MIIYLYGSDSYRRGLKARELSSAYRAKHEQADFLDVDLSESFEDWILVRDFLDQTSLFTPSKFCLVRESGCVPEENVREWIKILQSVSDASNVFLVISDSSKPVKAFSFLLKPPVKNQEFGELAGKELQSFILKEAGARGVKFDSAALHVFTEYCFRAKERTRTAVSELEKIALARFSQPIVIQDLQKIVFLEAHDESFQIALHLLRARGTLRLERLEEIALKGDEPRYTLNLLGSLARGEDAVALARADEMVKGGESEDEVALTGFALGL